jgi:hypothetical protein
MGHAPPLPLDGVREGVRRARNPLHHLIDGSDNLIRIFYFILRSYKNNVMKLFTKNDQTNLTFRWRSPNKEALSPRRIWPLAHMLPVKCEHVLAGPRLHLHTSRYVILPRQSALPP